MVKKLKIRVNIKEYLRRSDITKDSKSKDTKPKAIRKRRIGKKKECIDKIENAVPYTGYINIENTYKDLMDKLGR